MELDELQEAADAVRTAIAAVVVGQERVTDHLLIGLLAEGHVLLEGLPGTAKTLGHEPAQHALCGTALP